MKRHRDFFFNSFNFAFWKVQVTFSRYKLFDTAFKMDKDKKTVGSLSSGDFESNDFLIKQGRGKTRDVVINNFSKKNSKMS